MKNITEKLNKVSNSKLSKDEASYLWSRIESDIKMGVVHKEKFVFRPSFAISVALIVLILTSGSIAARTVNAAVPGDKLFPVDEFMEKVSLAFTKKDDRPQRNLQIADERLEEAETVVARARANANVSGDTQTLEVQKSEHALSVALDRLETIRTRLEDEGSGNAVVAVDGVINRLLTIANEQVEHLDEVDNEISNKKDESEQFKQEVRQSRQELKFKFDYLPVEASDDSSDSTNTANDESATSGRSLDTKFDVEAHDWKVYLCHRPSDYSSKSFTIAVGSPAAERYHLANGDTEGSCEDNAENIRGASIETQDNRQFQGDTNIDREDIENSQKSE